MSVDGIFTTRVRIKMGGYVFTGVCLFRRGGGTQSLVPGAFPASGLRTFLWGGGGSGYPCSLVFGPRSFPFGGGGTPCPGNRTGVPPPPSQDQDWYPPPPDQAQDRGTHWPLPPPPPPSRTRNGHDAARAVRLLRFHAGVLSRICNEFTMKAHKAVVRTVVVVDRWWRSQG